MTPPPTNRTLPLHQGGAVYFGSGHRAVISSILVWEGNRWSGVALPCVTEFSGKGLGRSTVLIGYGSGTL